MENEKNHALSVNEITSNHEYRAEKSKQNICQCLVSMVKAEFSAFQKRICNIVKQHDKNTNSQITTTINKELHLQSLPIEIRKSHQQQSCYVVKKHLPKVFH